MRRWLKGLFGVSRFTEPTDARALSYGFATPAGQLEGRPCFDYWSTHDSGLFSNCSTALADVLALHREGASVRRIDYSHGMGLYKDQPGRDVYDRFFFNAPAVDVPPGLEFDPLDAHASYHALPLAEINQTVRRFFGPSREVEALAKAWSDEIGLDFGKTIAIYFRGTDKAKEIQLAPIEAYIDAARRLDAASGGGRTILVQTDQAQARQAVVAAFGERARFFAAMPVTRRAKGIHKQWVSRALAGGAEASALQMLAAVVLLSRCAELVLTTSNVGAWMAFYRGHARGLHQFGAEGRLTEVAPN